MECADLVALRREATALFRELAIRKRRAREYDAAHASRGQRETGLTRRRDFEGYLQRRLSKSAARIEAHIARHACQAG